MPGVDFRSIRSQVTMSQVLRLLNFVPCAARGDQLRGPCPIHGSSSPRSRSFSANLQKQKYRCFKCGAAGNQLDLWAAATKLPLHAAAVELCERLGLHVPWIDRC